MANASRDNNQVTTMIALLLADGLTLVPLMADPTSHALQTNTVTTGADNGPTNAKRDANQVTVLLAASSGDGTTPVALYATTDGKLLTKQL
jgi:hypothetical protein